jgi:hypothetical protein
MDTAAIKSKKVQLLSRNIGTKPHISSKSAAILFFIRNSLQKEKKDAAFTTSFWPLI